MLLLTRFSLRKRIRFYRYGFLLLIPFFLLLLSVAASASAHTRNGKNSGILLSRTLDGGDKRTPSSGSDSNPTIDLIITLEGKDKNTGQDVITGELSVKFTGSVVKNSYIILPFSIVRPDVLRSDQLNALNGKCNNNQFTTILLTSNPSPPGNTSASILISFSIVPIINQSILGPAFLVIADGSTPGAKILHFKYNYLNLPADCQDKNNQIIYPSEITVRFPIIDYSLIPPDSLSQPGQPTQTSIASTGLGSPNSLLFYPIPIVQSGYGIFTEKTDFFQTQDLLIPYTYTSTSNYKWPWDLSQTISIFLVVIGIFFTFTGTFLPVLPERIHLTLNAFVFCIFTIFAIMELIGGVNAGNIFSGDNIVGFSLYGVVITFLLIYGFIKKPAIPSLTKRRQEGKNPMPTMGETFLTPEDRLWITSMVNTVIDPMKMDGMKNLLRSFISDQKIERINYDEGKLNIAEEMVADLEKGGTLSSDTHVLGAFLAKLIEERYVDYDADARIMTLLSQYPLIKNSTRITFLQKLIDQGSGRDV